MAESKKQYRAKMRAKHGPDWWKKDRKKAKKPAKKSVKGGKKSEWPHLIGGVFDATVLTDEAGMCYRDAVSMDDYPYAICLEKRGGRFRLYEPGDDETQEWPETEIGTFTKKEALAYLRKEAKAMVKGHKRYGTYWDVADEIERAYGPQGPVKW